MSDGGASDQPKRVPPLTPEELELLDPDILPSDRGQDAAVAESKQLSSGKSADELKKEAEESEHGRSEAFKNHFGCITVVALYLMAFGVTAFAGVWAYHVLTPISYHWLTAEQLAMIQNLVTGGVLVGVIAEQFRRRLGRV